MRIVVVFPEPLRPTKPCICPGAAVSDSAVERLHVTEPLGEVAKFEHAPLVTRVGRMPRPAGR